MLVFLPGLICDARIFAPQLAAFPQAKAIGGYGLLDRLEDMAQFVLDSTPGRFDLFGHSMGGRIALEILRLAPDRVRRLALVSTGVHGVQPGEADKRHELTRLGHDHGFAALVDRWLPPMVAPAHHDDPAVLPALRAMCFEQGQARWEAQVAALLARSDRTAMLPAIACPTLVMTGALDQWSPPAQHREFAAAIPGATLAIVPGAGHMIQREAPDAVNTAIARWLAQPTGDGLLSNPQGEQA